MFPNRSLLAATALTASLAPALAGVIQPGSRLTDVTVYPDAAVLKREIVVEVPAGSHEIVIPDLPATLDPASLRIEGAAEGKLSIGNLDLRARAASDDDNPERTKKLNALRLDKDRLSDRIDAVEGKKAMIQRAANPADKEGRLDPAQWSAAWDIVGKGLQAANDELRGLRIVEAKLDAEIAALENPEVLARMPGGAPHRAVTIAVEAQAATKARLTLSYRVRQAGWRPVYNARLITRNPQPSLELTRRALLRQNTGEDWNNAQVTLATTPVGRGTSAPQLNGERIGFEPPPAPRPAPMPMSAPQRSARMKADVMAAAAPAQEMSADAAPIEEIGAAFEAGNFQGEFRIPGAVTLPSGGVEKSFRLGADKPEISLSLRAAPAIDPTAYLEAAFKAPGEAPLLPGEVLLTRDETFVGKSMLALTPAGELARLGFGADDSLKIKRITVNQKTSEPGLLGSNKSARSEFRISAKNLHAFPVALILEDRVPVSEDQVIVVERAPEMTKPDVEAPEERRGIVQWKPVLKAGEEKNFTTAYTVRWPADRPTRLVPLPR
jgi:uncharacterized protein (TIGR02231 family)